MYQKLIRILWISFFSSVIFFGLYITSIYYNWNDWYGDMPDLRQLENPKNELASELYSADGVLLGKYFRENRTPVTYQDLSPALIHTLKATEDIRFEEHSGIDFKGTLAVVGSILKMDPRGASTVTQQLAKNLFGTRRDEELLGSLSNIPVFGMVSNKFKEWILAIRLERTYTKQEIMTMYLNTVNFSNNAYGINVAARTFFAKYPHELDYSESAVLVGQLKAPTTYSPTLNPKNALRRRNVILNQLAKYGYINQTKSDTLKNRPIDLSNYKVENHNSGTATYFRKVASNFLRTWCKDNGLDLYSDGLKIYTTVNYQMQQYAEDAVKEHMKQVQDLFFERWKGREPWRDEKGRIIKDFLENSIKRTDRYRALKKMYGNDKDKINQVLNEPRKMRVFDWNATNYERDTVLSPMDSLAYYKHFLHAGMMAMNPQTGHIKAWVGGINHKYFKYDHVQQGRRQPGSTFKPFTYAMAMESGKHPCDIEEDSPITFKNPRAQDGQQVWTPSNSDGYSFKKITLRQAMARSINTIAAKMIGFLSGNDNSGETGARKVSSFLTERLGIKGPIAAVPSICLGSSDVSVYEMVGAYSSFVNQGVWIKPIFITRIEDKNGKVLHEFVPKKIQALNENVAYTMVHMLKGGLQEPGGTSMRLHQYEFTKGNAVGGKTGTTSNNSDAWYMGITKDLVSGIWTGGDDRSIHFRSTYYGQGARQAMPAYAMFMEKVFADETLGYEKGAFPMPEGMNNSYFDCSQRNIIVNDSTKQNIYMPSTDHPDF